MRDDGHRLTFSLGEKSFTIQDMLTGELVIYNRNTFITFSIDLQVLISHLQNLQEAIMTYPKKNKIFYKGVILSSNDSFIIRENAHLDWTLSCAGQGAEISDMSIKCSSNFDWNDALKLVNNALSKIVYHENHMLTPASTARRIADVGLIVIRSENHSLVFYETNLFKQTICNCLLDGDFFKCLIAVPDNDETFTLYTSGGDEVITIPVDASTRRFFCNFES